jgi:hypothetical protein
VCSRPICIFKFTPIANIHELRAELSPTQSHLIIYGMYWNNIPSFGVIRLTYDNKKRLVANMVYSDSVMAVSDACFCEKSLFIVPRFSSGLLINLGIPESHTDFEHRVLPPLSVAGFSLDQMRFASGAQNPQNLWRCVTWTDKERPTLSIHRFMKPSDEQPRWKSLSFEFMAPAWIQGASFGPYTGKLAFALTIGDSRLVCCWDIDRDDQVSQSNYPIDIIGDLLALKWQKSHLAGDRLFVIGSLSIMEITKTGNILICEQSPVPIVAFCDFGSSRFYVNQAGELHICHMRHGKDMGVRSVDRVSCLKVAATGDVVSPTGYHLYRCGYCRLPLRIPLLSRTDDGKIQQIYCSRDCQGADWREFVAARDEDLFEDRMKGLWDLESTDEEM